MLPARAAPGGEPSTLGEEDRAVEFYEDEAAGVVVVALRPGDLLLESLREVARQADVHTGVVLSGLGSLTRARFHTVATSTMPPEDLMIELTEALEVISFGGIIASHEPHLHISLMTKDLRYYGGHVEEGCSILTLAEISILRLPTLRLERRPIDETRIRHLRLVARSAE
jgi:uncharacterized protein